MNGSRLFLAVSIAGVPVAAHRYFNLAISIDITSCDTDVVAKLGALPALVKSVEDVLFPGWIFVPPEVALVGEEDVLVAVSVDIAKGEAVSNGDLRVDGLGVELGVRSVNGSAVETEG